MTLAQLTPRERIIADAYAVGMPTTNILVTHKISAATLYRVRLKAGLPLRRPMAAKTASGAQGRRPPEATRRTRSPPGGEGSLDVRLKRLLSESIADLEACAAEGGSADPGSTARALALNVRTLATLRRVAGEDDDAARDDTGPPARSLSELRDELHGHLQRIRHEEAARRRARKAGAADG